MVAAVLLAAGLLALVASQRAVQRLDLLGRRTAEAAEAAASRLALLRLTACAAPSAGTAAGAIAERWSAAPGALAGASVVVTFIHDSRPRAARYDALIPCAGPP